MPDTTSTSTYEQFEVFCEPTPEYEASYDEFVFDLLLADLAEAEAEYEAAA